MSVHAGRCPKCNNFILGTYCYNCDLDIRDVANPFPTGNPLHDFFQEITEEDE